MCDITTGYSTCMECSHCKLCSRFSDGLRCCYSHSFSNIYRFSCCKVPSITFSTYSINGFAIHYGSDFYCFDSAVFNFFSGILHYFISGFYKQFLCFWIVYVFDGCSSNNSHFQWLDYFLAIGKCSYVNSACRSAIFFSDDYVMTYIYQPSSQVPGIGSSKCCIGKSLSSSVGRNKVF